MNTNDWFNLFNSNLLEKNNRIQLVSIVYTYPSTPFPHFYVNLTLILNPISLMLKSFIDFDVFCTCWRIELLHILLYFHGWCLQTSFHFSINENYMYTKSCTDIITYIWVHSETRFRLHSPKTRQLYRLLTWAYSAPCQTSEMEYFALITNGLKLKCFREFWIRLWL